MNPSTHHSAPVASVASPATGPAEDVRRARVHLAAANRLAVHDALEEGIDNHFTMMVPGHDDRYLVLPFGRHWSEARASDMIVFDETGKVLEGEGELELSTFCIHAPLHRLTGAKVVLHTHQSWALALNMLEDNRLLPACQTTAYYFTRNIAYDDGYAGLAHHLSEGERLASIIGSKQVLFMKNHGVVVVGDTVAGAYRRLYKLEKVCKAQVLAMSTGRPIALLTDAVVDGVERPNPQNSHSQAERERLYFAAMMRVLDRVMPGYAD
jgi:ribulose-5-phosphate 4-epimerase/fuculose-1-phosphate aldolase